MQQTIVMVWRYAKRTLCLQKHFLFVMGKLLNMFNEMLRLIDRGFSVAYVYVAIEFCRIVRRCDMITWPPGAGAPTVFATVYRTSTYSCSSCSGRSISSSGFCSRSFSGSVSARVSETRIAEKRRLSRFHDRAVKLSKYDPSVSCTLKKRGEFFYFFALFYCKSFLDNQDFNEI